MPFPLPHPLPARPPPIDEIKNYNTYQGKWCDRTRPCLAGGSRYWIERSIRDRSEIRHVRFPSSAERELVPLALLFQRSSALDAGFLLLEFASLSLELFFHLPMPGVQLFLALLEFALLLGNLLLEDHLHFALHLLQLLFVQSALLLLLDSRVDLLEHARVLSNTHLRELVRAVILVKRIVCMFLELFHVCSDKHLSELDKVTVILVIDLDDAPRVPTTANVPTLGARNLGVRTNDSEWNLRHDLLVLGNRLFVVELVARTFKNLNGMVRDVGQDLDL